MGSYTEKEQEREQAIYKHNSDSSSMVTFSFRLDEHDHLRQSLFDPFIPFGEVPRPDSMRLDKEKVREHRHRVSLQHTVMFSKSFFDPLQQLYSLSLRTKRNMKYRSSVSTSLIVVRLQLYYLNNLTLISVQKAASKKATITSQGVFVLQLDGNIIPCSHYW